MALPDRFPVPFYTESEIRCHGLSLDDCVDVEVKGCTFYILKTDRNAELEWSKKRQAIRQWLSKPYPQNGACGCMGPRDGEPACPCAMAWHEKVGDDWYIITETRTPDGVTHDATKVET